MNLKNWIDKEPPRGVVCMVMRFLKMRGGKSLVDRWLWGETPFPGAMPNWKQCMWGFVKLVIPPLTICFQCSRITWNKAVCTNCASVPIGEYS